MMFGMMACATEPEPDLVVGVIAECRDNFQQLITGDECINAVLTSQKTPNLPALSPTPQSNDSTTIQQSDGSTWTLSLIHI